MSSISLCNQTMPAPLSPAELWRQLKSIDFLILDHLAYLSRLRAAHSPKRAHYATPGRAWLAAKAGVSVSTITRHTTRLKALGLLDKRQRRPVEGKWQTNLYVLVGRAAWIVARSMHAMRRRPNRRASVRDLAPSEGRDGRSAGTRAQLRGIIDTLQKKLRGS